MANIKNRKKRQPNKQQIKIAANTKQISPTADSIQGVPSSNIIDLRSIVAKREVQKAREDRVHKQELFKQELQKQKKERKRTRLKSVFSRSRKATPNVTTSIKEASSAKKDEQTISVPVFNESITRQVHSSANYEQNLDTHLSHQATESEMAFWHEEQAEEKIAVPKPALQPEDKIKKITKKKSKKVTVHKSKTKKEKKKKQKKTQSFWERPIYDDAFDPKNTAELPVLGFSMRTVVKPTLLFAALSIIFIIPASVSAMLRQSTSMEQVVVQNTEVAFEHLMSGGESIQDFDFESAESEFNLALESFTTANSEIEQINSFVISIAKYIPGKGKELDSARHLIATGQELAAAGEQLSKALAILNTVDVHQVSQQQDTGLTTLLVVVHSALAPAVDHIISAVDHVQQVEPSVVPEDKRELVTFAQETLPEVKTTLIDGLQLTDTLLAFLGHEEERKYLVLFQNNHEIRPTGGFIGSLALVDISQGVVTGLDVPGGGVYDVSGQLTEKVISPTPLHLVNPHWNLQDANWFPHFPTSAEKIQWFYEYSGGTAVDGVIALTPEVIEKLLLITGPIDLQEEFEVTITAENFYEEVQMRAEEKYDVTRESKKIIGVMTPILLNNLFATASEPDGLIRIISVLRESTAEKDILVYMNEPTLQDQFSKRDWSGELKETDRDYLGIFHANIAGGKTDDVIEEAVKHRAEVQTDGSVIDTVTLTRVHKGASTDELRGVNNSDFVRFYLPEGSQLLSAEGFEFPDSNLFLEPEDGYELDQDLLNISGDILINELTGVYSNDEFSKSVFGGWMLTPYGESSTVTITYRLPFKLEFDGFWNSSDRYSLLVQKQPGSFGNFFISELVLPSDIKPAQSFPDTYTGNVQTILDQDIFVGMVLEKKR